VRTMSCSSEQQSTSTTQHRIRNRSSRPRIYIHKPHLGVGLQRSGEGASMVGVCNHAEPGRVPAATQTSLTSLRSVKSGEQAKKSDLYPQFLSALCLNFLFQRDLINL